MRQRSRNHPLCSQDDLGKKILKSLENLSQLEASETNARAAKNLTFAHFGKYIAPGLPKIPYAYTPIQ
jgi:hypothetical protein